MGNKQSQGQSYSKIPPKKNDKTVNDEKLLKVGLGLGRGDLRVEGNFQMGWHRRCTKRYKRPDPETVNLVEAGETEEVDDDVVDE